MSFFSNLATKVASGAEKLATKIENVLAKIHVELVAEWTKWYKMTSMYAFALLGCIPDLYNLAVQSHLIDTATCPPLLARSINVIAFIGAASRLVKQRALMGDSYSPVMPIVPVSTYMPPSAMAATQQPVPTPVPTVGTNPDIPIETDGANQAPGQ